VCLLARFAENDTGPTLDRELEIDPRWSKIYERSAVIYREVIVGFLAELLELLGIIALDPAGRLNADRLECTLDGVFVLQPESHHLELQLTNGAEDLIVIAQGAK
jgi:hypothetical protein